ncbi:hypothetical protein, partial [Streptomyces sp. NPDC002599]|uniref:hypothetical protein n=1 Tax=Streptomyces sp. NPDC002599 TaxID=3154421 RepID=UPI00331EBEE8
ILHPQPGSGVRGRAGTSMPVATDGHASSNGDGLMHRHVPDPPTGAAPHRERQRSEPAPGG